MGTPVQSPPDCSAPGTLACAGHRQKLTLVCAGSGQWETNETCGAVEFCSSVPGDSVGTCLEPDAWCADKDPAARGCDDKNVRECDVDGLTSEIVESCPYVCKDGECDDSCAEGVLMNCTEDCGGPTACAEVCEAGLDGAAPTQLLFEAGDVEPGVVYTLRLPPVTDDYACLPSCRSLYGLGRMVALRLPEIPGYPFYQIRAEAPWAINIVRFPKGTPACLEDLPGNQVMSVPRTCTTVEWFETDPDSSALEYQVWLFTPETTADAVVATIELGESFPDAVTEGCFAPTWL